MTDFIDLILYPLQKVFVLLASCQFLGVSLLSLLAGALIISCIFTFFVGSHTMGAGESFRRTNEAAESAASGTTKGHHGEGD